MMRRLRSIRARTLVLAVAAGIVAPALVGYVDFQGQKRRIDAYLIDVLTTTVLSPALVASVVGTIALLAVVLSFRRRIPRKYLTEHASAESTEKFRRITESDMIGTVFWTVTGEITGANDLFLRTTGYTREDLEAGHIHWKDMTPPEYTRLDDQAIEQLRTRGVCPPFEKQYFRKDGSRVDVLLGGLVLDKNGAGIAFVLDITERKRAADALLLKNALLEAQSETAIDGILAVDVEGRTLLANRRFSEMWGIPVEVLATENDHVFRGFILSQLKNPQAFQDDIQGLYARQDERRRDEIELNDGRVFDRYTSPLMGKDGRYFGRVFYFRDLTERKRAEETLRGSEELLASILSHIPYSVFWKNRDLKFLGCNHDFAADARLESPDDVVGMTDYDLPWKRCDADYYRECDRRVIETGVPSLHFEEHLQTSAGEDRVILTSKVPLHDARGEVMGVLGIYTDITDRKRMEQALVESERFAKSTVDALAAHIAILDENGTILATNSAWREFAAANDASPERSGAGVNYLEVCDAVTGEGKTLAHGFGGRLRQVIDGRLPSFEMEYPCHSPTQERWFLGGVTRFQGEGPTRIVVAHMDISQRKQIEQQLRTRMAAIDAVDDMIIITTGDGVITHVNPAFTAATGYSAEEAIGRTPALLKSGLHDDDFYRELWSTIVQGRVWRGEITNRRKDGSLYPSVA